MVVIGTTRHRSPVSRGEPDLPITISTEWVKLMKTRQGSAQNIRVLLGVVPWRLEPLDKCGGRLLFADEPD